MARRRRNSGLPRPTTAFKDAELTAIKKGILKLYVRSLAHLVAPKFDIPNLPAAYTAMVAPSVWGTLYEADRIMHGRGAHNNSSQTTVELAGDCRLDVRAPGLLPEWEHIDPEEKVLSAWPTVLEAYASAADECRVKWQSVVDIADRLHREVKRSTAIYNWPCSTALMGLGGTTYTDDEITRPVPLAGELVVELRDSNTYVMQHMLLPPVEGASGLYEGNFSTEIAVGLEFVNKSMDGHRQLWPLRD